MAELILDTDDIQTCREKCLAGFLEIAKMEVLGDYVPDQSVPSKLRALVCRSIALATFLTMDPAAPTAPGRRQGGDAT